MRKRVATVALAALLIAGSPVASHAHGAALGLAAFAAFTALVALPLAAAAAYPAYYPAYPAPVYVTAPPAYHAPPPVRYAAPAVAAVQREVVYPHGRHVLYGDGVRTAYRWVWIPNPPAGPPPPPPPVR